MAVLKKIFFLNKKLKAATLVEAIVAMLIIMFSFGLAMMIYNTVLASENGVQKLRAHLLLNKVAVETKANRYFVDEVIEKDEVVIHKRTGKYRTHEHLVILELKAYDKNNKLLMERKELIYQK